jgi:hypothetical protein
VATGAASAQKCVQACVRTCGCVRIAASHRPLPPTAARASSACASLYRRCALARSIDPAAHAQTRVQCRTYRDAQRSTAAEQQDTTLATGRCARHGGPRPADRAMHTDWAYCSSSAPFGASPVVVFAHSRVCLFVSAAEGPKTGDSREHQRCVQPNPLGSTQSTPSVSTPSTPLQVCNRRRSRRARRRVTRADRRTLQVRVLNVPMVST